ncbi:MAG: 3-phosphoshikimate 1-carboxyvinyltransferase [Bacillales bacterium]|jgi:3-phosphoshikimate 1-carboxyvinyltransferase|nr:3-phosphoshikimate 1-carboxyvinyltransferase [Bacillales bacterium]
MTDINLVKFSSNLKGEITIPGDKSISHRSIIFGSIAEGQTIVENFLTGEDCLSTIKCFRLLGVSIEFVNDQIHIDGKGISGLLEPHEVLDVGNSGTTIRLMTGLLSAQNFHSVFTGDDSIKKRPMKRVVEPLRMMGANIVGRNNGENTPISINGTVIRGISYKMPIASAQVKSAIILAGIQADGETEITEEYKTRDHTERMLKAFGGNITTTENTILIKKSTNLVGQNIYVPGDISSAAFFMVAATLLKDSKVKLLKVGMNPTRTGIIDVLENMGAKISYENVYEEAFEPFSDIVVESENLIATELDGSIIPRLIDEIPIIALAATQATGTTIIKGAEELKVKETNRIDTVVTQLKLLGANIEATSDGMVITGPSQLKGNVVDSNGDHRIGMMLVVASLIAEGTTTIKNIDAINVSYPNFFKHLEKLTH